MFQERLACGSQDEPVDASVEDVELVDRHALPAFAKQPFHVEKLVSVQRARPLGRQADHEAFDVPPQAEQDALAGEIDRGNLNAVPRLDPDESIVRKSAHGLIVRVFDSCR